MKKASTQKFGIYKTKVNVWDVKMEKAGGKKEKVSIFKNSKVKTNGY